MFALFVATASDIRAQTFVAEWNAAADGGVGPTGMALSTENNVTYLYVSDHPRGRIIKFNTATGAVASVFGKQGNANGDFNAPYGIARDPVSGDFYVAERGNHRVSRITSSGAFVMAWGTNGSAQGQFNEPIGVAVDSAGDVYVTDHMNHRVQKFRITQTGGIWSAANMAMWGTQGAGNGQFNQPYGITADAAGNIWVADGFNGRIQRFNTSGTYQSTLGSAGTAPGQFIVATWLGVAPSGELFVTSTNSNPQDGTLADANNQWISRFTPAGVFTSRWGGTYGQGPGQFRLPFSAVVDTNNRAYVADYYNSRVQVFNLTSGGGTDTTPPTIATFTTGATTPTSVTFQITFSEAVTGVNSADFAAVTTGGAVATIGAVAGSGASYTVPVTFTGPGTVQLNLNASGTGIVDAANNAIAVGATGPTYTIPTPGTDTTAPTVASFTVGTSNATTVNFLLTFSEPVTGVNSADFAPVTTGGASATIGAVTGSGATYTIPVAYTGTGTIRLNLNATGTGIVDAANNPIAAGATGPLFTIGTGGGTTTGTQVTGITPPANGTYGKNAQLTFVVRFNGIVTVTDGRTDAEKNDKKGKPDDDDDDVEDDDFGAYFTWTAVQGSDSGKVQYISGSGTSALTFRLKVHNGDLAPGGILLGNVIRLEDGAVIRDANGAVLDAQRLTLPWTQNPLTGVILHAPKPGNGNGGVGNNGNGNNGNGNGKGRNDRLVNLSSRLRVTGGDASRSVVAGFVVTGQTSKQILIRAVGPGLAGFGVRDSLGQPVLVLRDSTGKTIAENDGWKNAPGISSAGNKLGPCQLNFGSQDAALLVTVPPGAYTAQVTANGNGIVLVEVYDMVSGSELSTEQIVNISTRGYVGTGDDVLVAGFVVTGNTPKRVLIRGIGPALSAFGVPGVLADPVLRLHAANGSNPIAQNDNWETPQPIGAQVAATSAEIAAASTAAGAFPLGAGGKDAAIVVTLPAGNYSAVVSGVGNGTGAGLVEVYELP